jgi:hypothetical protein
MRTSDIVSTLRDAGAQQAFIRTNRDWLYRCQRAWQPVLQEWDHAGNMPADGIWQLIETIYQFLAPRYMPVTEWQSCSGALRDRAGRQPAKVMTW